MSKTNSTAINLDRNYMAARTIVTVFKLMGLAPFVVRSSASRKPRKKFAWQCEPSMQLSTSRYGCVYNLCLIASQLCMLVLTWPVVMSDESFAMTSLNKGIDVAACIIGYSTIFLIWLIFGFRQEPIVEPLNRLLSFNGTVLRIKDNRVPKFTRFFAVRLCLTNAVMIAALLYSDYLAYGFVLKTYVMYIVPATITALFLYHYTFAIGMIDNCFQALNGSLLDCCGPTLPVFSHRSYSAPTFVGICTTAQNVATLKRAHLDLGMIVSDIALYYSVPILFTIAYCCYTLIANAFYLSQPIVVHTEENVFIIIFSAFVWMSQPFLAIASLAISVTNVVKESKKTCDSVKKLLTYSNNSDEVHDELEEFSLQLLHQDIRFTACGLFSLDLPLLQSLFSAVIKYMIVVIQTRSRSSMKTPEISLSGNNTGKINSTF